MHINFGIQIGLNPTLKGSFKQHFPELPKLLFPVFFFFFFYSETTILSFSLSCLVRLAVRVRNEMIYLIRQSRGCDCVSRWFQQWRWRWWLPSAKPPKSGLSSHSHSPSQTRFYGSFSAGHEIGAGVVAAIGNLITGDISAAFEACLIAFPLRRTITCSTPSCASNPPSSTARMDLAPVMVPGSVSLQRNLTLVGGGEGAWEAPAEGTSFRRRSRSTRRKPTTPCGPSPWPWEPLRSTGGGTRSSRSWTDSITPAATWPGSSCSKWASSTSWECRWVISFNWNHPTHLTLILRFLNLVHHEYFSFW